MIQIYITEKAQLKELKDIEIGSWINIIDPNPEERKWIDTTFPALSEYIIDSLDLDEQARVEREDEFTMIIMRIPHFKGIEEDDPFVTLPLLVFMMDDYFITICKEENIILQEFIKERIKGFNTFKKNTFLLQLMLKTASKFLVHLRNINKIVQKLEDELEDSLRNKELIALLRYEKALIYYTTALKSNEAMLERLRRIRLFKQYEEDEELLEDVIIDNKQAIEMVNISQKVLNQMMNAFSSVINNNMNNVMKFLTFVTICIAIPTLLASMYGMNVPLPGQNSDDAFFYMLLISSILVLIVVLYFKQKKWF